MNKTDIKHLSDEERTEAIAAHISEILTLLGEDSSRQGLLKTPLRAAKALRYLCSGYDIPPAGIMKEALFDNEGSRIVTVRDIEFYSMCEHHILPFFGKVSVAYLPDKHIVGLSKLARVTDALAHRLQVQERFTRQLCDEILAATGAKGVLVKCTGEHMCMKMRGVEKQHAATVTVEYNGDFAADPDLRREALALL